MLRSGIELLYARYLQWQVKHVPRHVAVIQDGNRRYAREQGLDTSIGHRLGADATEQVLDWAGELGVQHITLYTFSTENFRRESTELDSLFLLFREKFAAFLKDKRVHRSRIRVQMSGDRTIDPAPTDPATVEDHLYRGAPIPPVDLIIRTGNDCRTSNFLPWLANGHESAVYFCAPYWPAFRKIDFLRAMRVYDQRMRLKERAARQA